MKERKGVPDTNHRMDTMVRQRQSRHGRQISTYQLKDNRIDPVLRYMLNILFVISFLKE